MADTNDLLHQIRNIVREENEPIKKRLDGLEQGQKDQGSAIARLEQGQKQLEQGQGLTNKTVLQIKTVVELTEETVNNMDEGLKEVVKDHRERIKRLEEQTRTTSHKN
jgi:hypothetical protein